MRVDEAGHNDAAHGVDDLRVRLGLRISRRPGEFDLRVFTERDAIFDHATRRYDRAAYYRQTICHIKIPYQQNDQRSAFSRIQIFPEASIIGRIRRSTLNVSSSEPT